MKNYIFGVLIIIFLVLVVAMTGKEEVKQDKKGNKTLEQMYADGDEYLLIDVRTPQEYKDGHIIGAINIPYDEIATTEIDYPLDGQIVVYCRSGNRSGHATNSLKKLGFTNILDYRIYTNWNGPVEYK